MNPNKDYLILNDLKKSNRNYVEKSILCICIAFYQRGFCEETLRNLMKSNESYSQAKWISQKFLTESSPELIDFLIDLNLRITQRISL